MKKQLKNEKKIDLSDSFNNNSMHLFTMLCGYFLMILVLYSFFQIIKVINLNFINIISIITPISFYLIICKEKTWKTKTIVITIFAILVLLVPFVFNKTYDETQDGNSYHKSAIAYIKNGWNPLYEKVRDFQETNDQVVPMEEGSRVDLWMEHYPKATWIIAAVMYEYTGNIESGKCITFIFNIMLLIILYNCLIKILDKKWVYALLLLTAINPIVLVQWFSYYVDGLMGILFGIEILLLMMIKPKEKISIIPWMCFASIAAIMVNIKFTGLLCSGVVAAVYYFYWLWKNRKEKDFIQVFKRITIAFSIVYVMAILLVGANSYVKNTIDHQNPLYPLMGKGKVDIITTMQPKSFQYKSKIEKFFISYFSKSQNALYDSEPTLKFPLMVYHSELSVKGVPDTRINGFGPLFTAAMILCVIVLGMGLVKLLKQDKEKASYFVLPLLSILISMILVGESWWARYVPQVYLVPIITIVLILYEKNHFKKEKIIMSLLLCFAGLVFVNSAIFVQGNWRNLQTFHIISKDIKEMKNTENLVLRVSTLELYGYYYTLNDNGVKYTVDKELTETNSVYKYDWRFMVKNDEELSETD